MENNVRLELNVNQVNVILAGIAKLPLETAYDTFNAIRSQVDPQLQQQQSYDTEAPLADKVIN